MIVKQPEVPVSASGISSEAFFTVKQENLPWIFGILRNSLYSDKPLAILREYSANALDAHAEAGVPNRPFVVSMPTALSPVLSIRDFGKGLSEEDVYNVFASYGESTKRSTNQQIGGFGIGSKSAFAYVNNFTIVSYFGGKKSMYEAFIDETNIGKVAKVIEEDTDEESGLEIIVAIKPSDIPAFVESAKNLFKHFDTKPIIKNNSELAKFLDEYVAAQPVWSGKMWTLAQRSDYRNSEVYCVMGNIRYPIHVDKLQSSDLKSWLWISSLYGMELVLRTPIGSVKMSASRESLEYDETTIKFLDEKIREVMQEIVVQIHDRLDACHTLWEARILLREIQMNIGKLSFSPVWKGQKVKKLKITADVLNSLVAPGNFLMLERSSNTAKAKWFKTRSIIPKADTVMYVYKGDVPRNSVYARIARDIEDNNRTGDVFLARFPSAQEAEAFVNHDEIVGANIVDVASINYTPPKRNLRVHSNGAKTKQKHLTFVFKSGQCSSVKSQSWEAKEIDVKDGKGVYVRTHGFAPVDSSLHGVDTNHALDEIIHNLYILTGVKTEIFGFRNNVSGLGESWVPLRQKIEEVLKAEFADPDFQAIVVSEWADREIDRFFVAGSKYVNAVEAHSKMGKLLNRIATMRSLSHKDKSRFHAVQGLAMMAQMTEELSKLCEKEQDELQRMVEEVRETYPMLFSMTYGRRAWEIYNKEILGYIALVDNQ